MPPGKGIEREKGGRCAGVVHCRGVYFASKQEPDCGYRLEVRFHFFCNSYKLKVSDKDQREDMHCNLQVGNVK